jgi:hypothetical protein
VEGMVANLPPVKYTVSCNTPMVKYKTSRIQIQHIQLHYDITSVLQNDSGQFQKWYNVQHLFLLQSVNGSHNLALAQNGACNMYGISKKLIFEGL